jgi:chromosome segregation ATPase
MNRIIQALENRTAELKAEEDAYRKESEQLRRETEQLRRETEQLRKETEELKQMNDKIYEIYYRSPNSTEHEKLDVVLDDIYEELRILKRELAETHRSLNDLRWSCSE